MKMSKTMEVNSEWNSCVTYRQSLTGKTPPSQNNQNNKTTKSTSAEVGLVNYPILKIRVSYRTTTSMIELSFDFVRTSSLTEWQIFEKVLVGVLKEIMRALLTKKKILGWVIHIMYMKPPWHPKIDSGLSVRYTLKSLNRTYSIVLRPEYQPF